MDDRSRLGVRETYEAIGEHFSKTRAYAWPEVEAFVEAQDPVDTALDLGCGNGRHAELLATRADRVVGLDISHGVLSEARDRAAEREFPLALVQGDAARRPLRDGCVDLAVYVATLHHLRDRETRVASLDELARVLAPGGRALVSVWSTEADRFEPDAGFDTTVDWTLPDGEVVPRFYHVYDPDEFAADLRASALAVEETWLAAGNCYGVVRSGGRETA